MPEGPTKMNSTKLPQFIAPMLARPGKPFDSAKHLFDVKWDGMRALAYVDGNHMSSSFISPAACQRLRLT